MYIPARKDAEILLSNTRKRLSKSISRVHKNFVRQNRTRARIMSLVLKVALVVVPVGALPVGAHSNTPVTQTNTEIHLANTATVFAATEQPLVPKPGESNAAVAAREATRKTVVVQPVMVKTADPSLQELRALYARAGDKYGVPASLIEAVHQIESGKSWDTAKRSRSGAVGPMQFLPSTFRSYCVRTGEGCNITSADDSIYAASLLLSANYNGSWDHALFAYNHSKSYVEHVKLIANSVPKI